MIQPCCSWLAETAELVNGDRNENGEWELGPGKSGSVIKDRHNRHELHPCVEGSGAFLFIVSLMLMVLEGFRLIIIVCLKVFIITK